MTSAEQTKTPEDQTRLIRHFQDYDVSSHPTRWSTLWDTDSSDLWDRGGPSPALIDLLEERRDLFYPFTADGRGRRRVLVPGCGKGYDVVALALHGFDAYGLDVSATGVSLARAYADIELSNPRMDNFGDIWSRDSCRDEKEKVKVKDGHTRGGVTFIEGDFFQAGWWDVERGGFDLVYDYTFLCALHPSMRVKWAARMAELLSPGGMLVCLEFPLYKDRKLPGPPWGVKGVYWDLLVEGGDGLLEGKEDGGNEGEDGSGWKGRGQFKRVLYVKPARSYEVGRGTDMLSVYVKKS